MLYLSYGFCLYILLLLVVFICSLIISLIITFVVLIIEILILIVIVLNTWEEWLRLIILVLLLLTIIKARWIALRSLKLIWVSSLWNMILIWLEWIHSVKRISEHIGVLTISSVLILALDIQLAQSSLDLCHSVLIMVIFLLNYWFHVLTIRHKLWSCFSNLFFDELILSPIRWSVLFVLVELFIVYVHFFQKDFHLLAGVLVFLLVFGTDAQIEWILTFLFIWSFFKTRTMTTQPKFHNLPSINTRIKVNSTFFNYPFHIGSFGPDNSPSNLKFSFIINLDFISARIFNTLIFFALIWIEIRRSDSWWFKTLSMHTWHERCCVCC